MHHSAARQCPREVVPQIPRLRWRRAAAVYRSTHAQAAHRADSGEEITASKKQDAKEESKFKLWLLCVKPPMYSVAVAPMVLGAGLAFMLSGTFPTAACNNFIIGGILIIAWLNLRCDTF